METLPTTGRQIRIRDLDPVIRNILTVAITDWLMSNPGALSEDEKRVAAVYPHIYDPSLTPPRHDRP